MPLFSAREIQVLQRRRRNVRNLCVLAHVDHGKTTMTDALVASNGIISARLSGKMRYMDSRKDEQERLITMKSSSISLLFPFDSAASLRAENVPRAGDTFLMNLIDSPGHVDFGSEVSAAVRICDGAFVVVDLVEGPGVQTHAVLEQAWRERLRVVLVLNKLDKLFFKLALSPDEAHVHITRVLEQVNAIVATLYNREELEATATGAPGAAVAGDGDSRGEHEDEEEDEEGRYFSPETGNVVFACAVDSWGFRTDDFARMYAEKMGFSMQKLAKMLWGEFYFDKKGGKMLQKNKSGKLRPTFEQFVLSPLWHVFECVQDGDDAKIDGIVKRAGVKLSAKERGTKDRRQLLQYIMRQWLPLSRPLLDMAVELLPDPITAQAHRTPLLYQPLPKLPPTMAEDARADLTRSHAAISEALVECSANDDAPVVVYVSKVFSVPKSEIGQGQVVCEGGPRIARPRPSRTSAPDASAPAVAAGGGDGEDDDDCDDELIAFARVFSGTVRVGQTLNILAPRYDPCEPSRWRTELTVSSLYLLMGRSLEAIDHCTAGNIVGIGGVRNKIFKTATLTSTPLSTTFEAMKMAQPLVHVVIEPYTPSELPVLTRGLELLNQVDPAVSVVIKPTGEHTLAAAGELHLERCLNDLKDHFAPIKLDISKPIVGFRETITEEVGRKALEEQQNAEGQREPVLSETSQAPGGAFSITVRCVPLPPAVVKALADHEEDTRKVLGQRGAIDKECGLFSKLQQRVMAAFIEAGWTSHLDQIWSIGPSTSPTNILFCNVPNFYDTPYWKSPLSSETAEIVADPSMDGESDGEDEGEGAGGGEGAGESADPGVTPTQTDPCDDAAAAGGDCSERRQTVEDVQWALHQLQRLESSVIGGFHLAGSCGPLCDEPMHGVAVFVDDVRVRRPPEDEPQQGPMRGVVMSCVKDACRGAFMRRSARLVEPLYRCDIQVSDAHVGDVYVVLGKRRCRVVLEELRESTDIFYIRALLPVIESFGFTDILLRQTSGSASTQLTFSEWEVMDMDPFFVPTTEEELEEYGENVSAIPKNRARVILDDVRRRKGLQVEDKIVEHAEKQRTLKRNK